MSTIPDVSAWQGEISLTTAHDFYAAGVREAFVKIGGGDDGIYHDGRHDGSVRNFRQAGIRANRYFFNGSDPSAAADAVKGWLGGNGSVGLASGERFAWDVEGDAWSADQVRAATFRLGFKGSDVGFYASASMLNGYASVRSMGCWLWVAQYGSNSGRPEGSPFIGPWAGYAYWQYTSNGSLPGYSGRIDLSTTDGTGTPGSSSSVVSGGNITGRSTKVIQEALIAKGFGVGASGADGVYGPATTAGVTAYQKSVGITPDGIYGPVTDSHLFGVPAPKVNVARAPRFPLPAGSYFGPRAGSVKSVSGYFSHQADLKVWQKRMAARGWVIAVDGFYGPQTEAVCKAFQAEKHLTVDGLIGPATWTAAFDLPIT